jgi:predicted dehydrogenase
VQAWTERLGHRAYEVEDTAHVRLAYDGGRAATLFATWAARSRATRVHIVGERGAITWIDGTLTLERDGASESHDFARELDKAAYASWFARLFGAFADALDEGALGPAARRALDDVVDVATVLEAAYASAAAGTPASVAPAGVAPASVAPEGVALAR